MRATALILSTVLSVALATPAVVWKNSSPEPVVHTSSRMDSSDLLSSFLDVDRSDSSSLSAVIFLLARSADDQDTFTSLASSGSLPRIGEKSEIAETFYHHVAGIQCAPSFAKAASNTSKKLHITKVNLEDFQSKMSTLGQPVPEIEMDVAELGVVSKAVKLARKKARDLSRSDVLIVNIDPMTVDAAEIDGAVVSAVESQYVRKVLLTGVRSINEVKQERYAMSKKRMDVMETQGQKVLQARRRRLEQEDQAEDEQNQNQNNADLTGVYYVSMTPNIFSGILFTMLFAVITWIGVSCMGAIAGQDVYVTTMPSVGREA